MLIAITIANAVYFNQVYSQGSENLSSSQAQQLTVLNIVMAFLLFFLGISVVYMMTKKSEVHEENKKLKEMSMIQHDEFNEKLNELKHLNQEIGRNIRRVSFINENQKDEVTNTEKLMKKIKKLESKLDEKDKDLELKAKIIKEKDDKLSIFSEGIFTAKSPEDEEELFESDNDELFELENKERDINSSPKTLAEEIVETNKLNMRSIYLEDEDKEDLTQHSDLSDEEEKENEEIPKPLIPRYESNYRESLQSDRFSRNDGYSFWSRTK